MMKYNKLKSFNMPKQMLNWTRSCCQDSLLLVTICTILHLVSQSLQPLSIPITRASPFLQSKLFLCYHLKKTSCITEQFIRNFLNVFNIENKYTKIQFVKLLVWRCPFVSVIVYISDTIIQVLTWFSIYTLSLCSMPSHVNSYGR